jgi:5-dehydro-2-deoxygluconokinase
MSFEHLVSQIKKNNFLIIGRAGIDIYPDPPGTKTEDANNFVTHLGGSSANIAVELTKLGGNCNLLTRVSDDALGRLAINQLKKYNINTDLIKFQGSEARISFAIVESRIEDHQSIIYRNGAADSFMNESDIINTRIEGYDCVILTGTCFATEPSRSASFLAMKIANDNNIPVIMDIDYRPYTWTSAKDASITYINAAKKCAVVIGNDDEFGVLSIDYDKGYDFAKSLANEIDLVIYKKGEKGSVTFMKNNEFSKGIFEVKPLKPTGAGDAFMGGLIGSLLNDYSIEESVEIGSAAAAIVVTKVGCAPAMPLQNEIEDFMKSNKIKNYID